MQIADGKVVSIEYVLTVDGEEIARTDADDLMEYLHGVGEILPGLETALTGKKIGDSFSITLPPEDAYGDYDEEDIEEIDKSDIPNVAELEVGMIVEVEDEDGYSYTAEVQEIRKDVVVLDFNPPLAGKTLTYDVVVRGVRDATEEEIEHGHAHSDWDEDEDWDGYEDEDEDSLDRA
ncbi:MAG: peptidylprolyl isomerase [Anaerolineae bacterium]|nr:peptidylprolyl isomerase [Anaerolineae bacterium]NUQ06206.1 peptidylprolyl isomerase [Anaerolineae bacterium]